uniref:Kinesin family member 13B n=1 Tax=Cyanoderma ruficeps TaxID=181631 RepID=A0A8C3R3A0_9PASS
MGDSKVKVAVRVRPMNRRELDLHTKCVVDVDANKVILHPVNTNLSKGDARGCKKYVIKVGDRPEDSCLPFLEALSNPGAPGAVSQQSARALQTTVSGRMFVSQK